MNIAFLETASGSGSMWSSIIMMALIIVVFWFFIIRPQRKKDKETAKMRSELQVGDEIVTIGGMVGKVVHVTGDKLTFETGEDRVRIEMTKWAIGTKGSQTNPEPAPAKKEKKDEKK